jgi:hypothetical protein
MLSYEIVFIVEAVHAAYPDCAAKRCVDRRNERWQRVRIEFESTAVTSAIMVMIRAAAT